MGGRAGPGVERKRKPSGGRPRHAAQEQYAAGRLLADEQQERSVGLELGGERAVVPGLGRLLSVMMGLNLVLFVFNLIPVWPLDGGTVAAGVPLTHAAPPIPSPFASATPVEGDTIQPLDQDRWIQRSSTLDLAQALRTFQELRRWNLALIRTLSTGEIGC